MKSRALVAGVVALVIAALVITFWLLWPVGVPPGNQPTNAQEGPPRPAKEPKRLAGGDARRLLDQIRAEGGSVTPASSNGNSNDGPKLRIRLVSDSVLSNPLMITRPAPGQPWTEYAQAQIEVPALPGNAYEVCGTADGHFVGRATGVHADGNVFELRLEPYGELDGVVTDPADQLVADARVSAVNYQSNRVYAAVSSKTGQWRMQQLPPGRYRLVANAPGLLPSNEMEAEVFPLSLSDGYVLQLQQRQHVRGLVRDARSGLPLAGARVEFLDPGNKKTVGSAVSGDDGVYLFDMRRAAASYRVVVTRIGYKHLDQLLPPPVRDLDFDLEPDGVPLTVTVTGGPDGRVLAGAVVELLGRVQAGNDSPPVLVATTDSDGKAEFALVSPGVYRADVTRDGFLPAVDRFSVSPRGPARIKVQLDPASRVRVSLQDVGGATIAGGVPNAWWFAYPHVGSFDRANNLPQHVGSGEPCSEFVVSALPPGTYTIYVFAPDYLPGRLDVTIPPGESYEAALGCRLEARSARNFAVRVADELLALAPQQISAAGPDGDLPSGLPVPKTCIVEGHLERGAGRVAAAAGLSAFFFERGFTKRPVVCVTDFDAEANLDDRRGLTLVLPSGHVFPLVRNSEGVLGPATPLAAHSAVQGKVSKDGLKQGGLYFVAACPVHDSSLESPAVNAMDCIWVPLDEAGDFSLRGLPPDHYAVVLFQGASGVPDGNHMWVGVSHHVAVNLLHGRIADVQMPRR